MPIFGFAGCSLNSRACIRPVVVLARTENPNVLMLFDSRHVPGSLPDASGNSGPVVRGLPLLPIRALDFLYKAARQNLARY